MATLAETHPTMLDLAKLEDPDGGVATVIEILAEENELLDDMVWMEGNLKTGHQSVLRTGYPAPTWRKMYGGVQPSKGTTATVTDNCGSLEAYAEVDKKMADLGGKAAAYRMDSTRSHIIGMTEEITMNTFYGNEGVDPEKFTGFAPRFNDNSGPENAENIILGDGAGADNCSVWLVNWGPGKVHGIYPNGLQSGVQTQDFGEVTIENADGNGGRMQGYRSHFTWDAGLVVADWRYVVRIANIDVSNLTKTGSSGSDLIDLMTQALEQIQSLQGGRPAFYCNRTVRSFLRRQITNHSNVNLTMDEVAGKKVMHFGEVPVRRVDALTNTEATIS